MENKTLNKEKLRNLVISAKRKNNSRQFTPKELIKLNNDQKITRLVSGLQTVYESCNNRTSNQKKIKSTIERLVTQGESWLRSTDMLNLITILSYINNKNLDKILQFVKKADIQNFGLLKVDSLAKILEKDYSSNSNLRSNENQLKKYYEKYLLNPANEISNDDKKEIQRLITICVI
jgi:hypothetical protein